MPKRTNKNALLSPAVNRVVESFGSMGGNAQTIKANARKTADQIALKEIGKNLIPAVQNAIAEEQAEKAKHDQNINELNGLADALSEKK
jgi:hypothetical protein